MIDNDNNKYYILAPKDNEGEGEDKKVVRTVVVKRGEKEGGCGEGQTINFVDRMS